MIGTPSKVGKTKQRRHTQIPTMKKKEKRDKKLVEEDTHDIRSMGGNVIGAKCQRERRTTLEKRRSVSRSSRMLEVLVVTSNMYSLSRGW